MSHSNVYTIGHSTHDSATFVRLLQQQRITAVADVRSVPLSRHNPQFNRATIEATLDAASVKYVFLGEQLGARTDDPSCYVGGQVQYQRLSRTSKFISGIELLIQGIERHRIAIMCSEAEPLDCHRTVLIAQVLTRHNVAIEHIHRDGHLESHAMAMHRLTIRFGLHQADLFRSSAELLQEALARQEQRIAYTQPQLGAGVGTDR